MKTKASPVPQIQHLKSTASLGVQVDLEKIASDAPKLVSVICRYDNSNPSPRSFLTMEILKYKTKAQIFSSGKMIIYGGASPDDAKFQARKYARVVQKMGYNVQFKSFKIANMTASCKCSFTIDLCRLQTLDPERMNYNPAAPMLVYRPKTPRVVLLIYKSGKIVFQKIKSHEQVMEAFRIIEPALNHFQSDASIHSNAFDVTAINWNSNENWKKKLCYSSSKWSRLKYIWFTIPIFSASLVAYIRMNCRWLETSSGPVFDAKNCFTYMCKLY